AVVGDAQVEGGGREGEGVDVGLEEGLRSVAGPLQHGVGEVGCHVAGVGACRQSAAAGDVEGQGCGVLGRDAPVEVAYVVGPEGAGPQAGEQGVLDGVVVEGR